MEIEFRGEGFSAGGPVFLFPYNHGGVALPAAESLATKIKAKRAGHVTLKHAEVWRLRPAQPRPLTST